MIPFSYLCFPTLASMWVQYMTAQSCVHGPVTSIVYASHRTSAVDRDPFPHGLACLHMPPSARA